VVLGGLPADLRVGTRTEPSGEVAPDVEVRWASLPSREEGQRGYTAGAKGAFLDVPEAGRFLIRAGGEILIDPDPAAGGHDIRVYLLGTCLGVLLHQRGFLVLHASGVAAKGGAVLFAGLSQPIVGIVGFQHAQLVVRAVLGVGNAACLLVFWTFLRRAFGNGVARWWTGMLVTQFHVMFYLSRTLPNMYAFALSASLLSSPFD
jgi:hypothetical protein